MRKNCDLGVLNMGKVTKILIAVVMSASIAIVCLTGCRDKKAMTIRMRAKFPLTGEVASYGQKAKRGIELAVEELNAAGGLLGRSVQVDFQDDRNDKKEAVSIMTKFATIDKVPVVFGSAGSSVSLAIAPLANRHKVILISPISSSSQLSTEGGPYFFRSVPADDLQAEILANWVHESGAKQVAVVYTNNSWGKPLADEFQSKF
jgi:branched-chain amino acid transport system substrate-binding protein